MKPIAAIGFACAIGLVSFSTAAMTLRQVDIECPIGGSTFKTTLAMSGTQFGQNLDRRPFGPIASPWPLAKCPDNGFVLFKGTFTEQELKQLRPYVLSPDYQALQARETDHYLAARLMHRLGLPVEKVAEALLRATWEVEKEARYRRYAEAALAAFKDVIARAPIDRPAAEQASYQQITGELERRLGQFDAAKRRFTALLADPQVRSSPLAPLVRQELALIAAKDSGTHAVSDGAAP